MSSFKIFININSINDIANSSSNVTNLFRNITNLDLFIDMNNSTTFITKPLNY